MTLLINDRNWQQQPQQFGVLPRFIDYGSPEALARGIHPLEDYPDFVVPEDEWKERIQEAHKKKAFPIHHFEASDVPAKSQGSTSFCWAYSMASAVEGCRLLEAQPYCRLAPATLGWLVDWRNAGYYLSETINGAGQRGIASSEFAPDGVYTTKQFKDGWEADALKHKPLEWFDTRKADMVKHCVSLLLAGLPLYVALNWWSHALAVLAVEWDENELHNLRWVYWNSHGDGRIEMVGRKGIPDEAYAVGSSTFSP